MTEGEILERVKRRLRLPRHSRVVTGIGDDCAIYRGRGAAEDLLLTTDLLIEGVHFLSSTHRPADIGHKALARGLSDIAAMGGMPSFCLLSLASAEIHFRQIDRRLLYRPAETGRSVRSRARRR